MRLSAAGADLGDTSELSLSLLHLLHSADGELMTSTLLSMSSSAESCAVLRQSGGLPLVVRLIHAPQTSPPAGARPRPDRQVRRPDQFPGRSQTQTRQTGEPDQPAGRQQTQARQTGEPDQPAGRSPTQARQTGEGDRADQSSHRKQTQARQIGEESRTDQSSGARPRPDRQVRRAGTGPTDR